MAKKSGLEIRADLNLLRQELNVAMGEFRKFNAEAIKSATGVKTVEKSAKDATKNVDGFASSFGRLTASFSIANIAANLFSRGLGMIKSGIQSFIRGSIDASSALTELDSKARQVFGDSFGMVQRQAAITAKEVGRASSSILQFSTDIGAVIDAAGLTGPAMANMSTSLAKLSVDMASFHNAADVDAFYALRSAITGETEPMKRFGVVLTQNNLALFAQDKGIKQSITTMNQAQMVALRYAFIMDRTGKAQGDAERTASSYANQLRRMEGNMRQYQEVLGKDITNVLAQSLVNVNAQLEASIEKVDLLSGGISRALTLAFQDGGKGADSFIGKLWSIQKRIMEMIPGVKGLVMLLKFSVNGLMSWEKNERSRDAAKDYYGAEQKPLVWGMSAGEKEFDPLAGFSELGGAGGAGGGGGADKAKNALEDIERIEKEILQTLNDQIDANREKTRQEREDLKLKEEMGTLTDDERRKLETLNRRLEFKTDLVEEATDAWKDQVQQIEAVEEKVKDLTQAIEDEKESLEETIAGIREDTRQGKTERLVDLVKELKDIEKDMREGNLSGQSLMNAETRKGEIDRLIDPFRTTKEGQGMLQEADKLSGLNEFELMDLEEKQRIEDATKKSEARQLELQADLDAETEKLETLRATEKKKRQIVIDALKDRETSTLKSYEVIQSNTKTHVSTMVAELNKLRRAYEAVSAAAGGVAGAQGPEQGGINRADGGPVFGAGGPRDDKIKAWLSNGEYVINSKATSMFRPMLDAINNFRMPIPRFANGGPVNNTYHQEKSATVTQYLPPSTAGDPRMQAWYIRTAL